MHIGQGADCGQRHSLAVMQVEVAVIAPASEGT